MAKSKLPQLEMGLKNIVVNTQDTDELDYLMRIFELAGGIKWSAVNQNPVEGSETKKRWAHYEKNTCIKLEDGFLSYGSKSLYRYSFPFEYFCHVIGVGEDKMKEINSLFEEK